MVQRLRGMLQVYSFVTRLRTAYAVCAIAGIMGVALALVSRAVAGVALLVGAVAIGVALTLYEEIAESQRSRYLLVERIDPRALSDIRLSTMYREYEVFKSQSSCAAYSRSVNAVLDGHALPFVWSSAAYHLRGEPARLRWFILRQKLRAPAIIFNEAKVRLASDMTAERIVSGEPLLLQQTDYFSSLCTNEMAMQRIVSTRRHETLLDGLRLLAPDGEALDLRGSPLSNHVGISSVALTRDHYLVVSRQGARNAQSAGLLGAAGSGSLDYSDMRTGHADLGSILRVAMQRELVEECGLAGRDVRVQTRLIGFARLLHRGGKPEFFGLSLLDASLSDLSIPSAERGYIAAIEGIPLDCSDPNAVIATLDAYARDNAHMMSMQLHLALRFLRDFLARSPEALRLH